MHQKSIYENALYIVATPIGNMHDITYRAVNILKNCDIILCENPKNSIKLLKFYEINNVKISNYNDYSNQNHREKILSLVKNNKIALISDAGTPLISDPGYKLIDYLRQNNIKIIPIPGASSLTSAICASGIACDNFKFLGFLPKSKNKRIELINKNINNTFIFFESPKSIIKTLKEIEQISPIRKCCIAREITKIYEEIYTDQISEIITRIENNNIKAKGEFVVILEKSSAENKLTQLEIIAELKKLKRKKMSLRDIVELISQKNNIAKKEIYKIAIDNL
ncbi:MAG: 16S rRNA (cytidine(1402)-2'-O)-methyltransferase [Rickettsiales bacterium]|jgi:16S rRNA (cytidine1402-2'-O)-methyltransferase|nr:16S rRNA (cytidine(1402)-2'-O)-methyltransferase [Rickettsiales bacterium]|tara:strand:- start:9059 stop:9901 length:843 start_codon:yes stop_codon:yes gene_type:complete